MNNCIIELAQARKSLQLPTLDVQQLPVKLGKRLWVGPSEFVSKTQALVIAEWSINACCWQPSLPIPVRRGRKVVYRGSSILVMALIQVAWQLSYEDVVDYLRSHPTTAQEIGFCDGRVIGVSQYWQRRRALGILPFWLFFVALAWQLIRSGILVGRDVILDATTKHGWFHADDEAAWSFPKPGKGSTWGLATYHIED